VKLHRVELEGFGPFRERQTVDFDAFADDGLFLLTGRTGAGKSSVLDGVCFALYGSVPRYADGDKRLRSDHCDPDDPSEVVLDFEVSSGRWRVARSPEYQRPKRRGDGFTTEGQRARLDEWVAAEWDGGEWMTRASGPRDVGLALDEILGLTRDQFLQVILLAQGRFQQFLLAKNDERQTLLRTLFGTRRYEQYQLALEDRRRAAERELGDGGALVGMLLDQVDRLVAERALGDPSSDGDEPTAADPAERLDLALRAVARASYRAETAVHARDAASTAFERASTAHAALQLRLQSRAARDRSRSALAALEEQAPAIAADRAVLDRAARAEELRDVLAAVVRADRAHDAAEKALAEASRAWEVAAGTEADGLDPADTGELRAHADLLTGRIAIWDIAQAVERELDEIRAAARATAEAVAAGQSLLSAIDERRAAVPVRVAELDARIAEIVETAAGVAPAEAVLAELEARLTAAREAERLATALHAAELSYTTRIEASQAAAAALSALMRRRLAGHAAELAGALVDGEPCAVCGSPEHPQPAVPAAGAEPVTDAEITAAEEARDAAAHAETIAAAAAREARAAHAEAAARAGGEAIAALELRRADQTQALAAARAAREQRDRLVIERTDLLARDAAAEAERAEAAQLVTEATAQAATARSRAEQAEQTVAEARGDAATVSQRIAEAATERDAARALITALEALALATTELAAASRERDERIDASVFADSGADAEERTAAVRAALLDEAARGALGARIRAHEIALASEKERLLRLELDLADDDGSELDETASAQGVADAREAWDLAVAAAAEAKQTAAALAELVQRADAAHAATAELAERHAVIQRLAHTVAGRPPNTHLMTLETFVLAAELEEIVERANLRLGEMSAGRYRLQHTDALARRRTASGLGLEVMDSFTGHARSPQSLSGGETFLASLALALGLAEAVTANAGGIRLDTLFIDEGFGSLDTETLDLAMRTLDELRAGGRTVGIISHVETMKEQVPAQLQVEATPQGPSRILQGVAIPG
jgi:exonuclease SbcC